MQFQPAATLPGAVCCGLVNANKPQRENHRGLHCMYSHDSFLLVIARAELVCYVHHTVFDGTHARRLLAARLTLADYQSNKKKSAAAGSSLADENYIATSLVTSLWMMLVMPR